IRCSLSWALSAELAKIDKKPAQAAQDFAAAVKLSPKQLGLYMAWSAVLFEENNLAAAIACLHQGLENLPGQPELRFRLAVTLRLTDKPDDSREAIAIFRGLLREDPESVPCLINLSELLAKEGQAKEALDLAERAIRIEPGEATVCFCYANRLFENKNYRSAAIQYRFTLDKSFMKKESREGLIACLREQGRMAGAGNNLISARAAWEEILALAPADAEAKKMLEQIREKQRNTKNN
ncbi:MAG: tetratricopeptide repeat protein, partial [Victivallales bacterium]|nr:tetratricopeptide repeat protein [Victivallales bacterium]